MYSGECHVHSSNYVILSYACISSTIESFSINVYLFTYQVHHHLTNSGVMYGVYPILEKRHNRKIKINSHAYVILIRTKESNKWFHVNAHIVFSTSALSVINKSNKNSCQIQNQCPANRLLNYEHCGINDTLINLANVMSAIECNVDRASWQKRGCLILYFKCFYKNIYLKNTDVPVDLWWLRSEVQ